LKSFKKWKTPLKKLNVINFHTWKVKIQMQLMNKNLWGIVKGTKAEPTETKQLIEWKNKDEKAKSIIGLTLSNSNYIMLIWKTCLKKFGMISTSCLEQKWWMQSSL
jgi:hypothetical protein